MREKRIDALTGVRAVAVLLVFFAHLQQRYFAYAVLDDSVVSGVAYYGMTTFFVLSGFVIHWNYGELFAKERRGAAWWKFFVARFARLWPLHFAVVLLTAVLYPINNYSQFAQHIFMVQTWVYEGTSNFSYFNTWSISTEWFFYFVYALGYPVIARCIRSGSILLLAAIAGLAFAAYWIAGPVVATPDMWLRYIAPYLRLFEFSTGVVAAQIVMTRRAQDRDGLSDAWLGTVIALTIYFYHTSLLQRTNINYTVAPIIAVALIIASDRRSFVASALSARWLLWIGDRSYSIYLLEAIYLAQSYRGNTLLGYISEPHAAFTWSGFAVGLTASVIGATMVLVVSNYCWRYFEMPMRKAIRWALSGEMSGPRPALIAPET